MKRVLKCRGWLDSKRVLKLYLVQAAKGLNDTATLQYAVRCAISAEAAVGGDLGAASEARGLLAK